MIVTLKQIDKTLNVAIPSGKTTLGRGGILKCVDKKVSRNHAELEVDEGTGTVHLKALQLPCYYEGAKGSNPKMIDKEGKQELFDGDVFSLLPDAHKYEVHIETEASEGSEPTDTEESKPSTSIKGKKRVLPAWLLQAATANGSTVKPAAAKKPKKTDEAKATGSKPAAKKSPTKKDETKAEEKKKTPKKKQHELSQSQDVESDEEKDTGELVKVDEVSEGSDDDGASASKVQKAAKPDKPKKRTPCMYKDKCYRKNPVHRSDFSHPDDSDYEEEKDEDDDKPECEYGIMCYRKNPQHKKDFKHTKRPSRKAAKEADENRKKMLDDDDDDEYDASFIDDSDEYNPNSDDSDEDVDELVSEAKEIIKKKV